MNIQFFQIFLAIALSAECSAGDFRCGEPIPVEKYGQIGSGGTYKQRGWDVGFRRQKTSFMLFVGMYDE